MALKIAEELEDWKERQQEIFRAKVMKISSTFWVWFVSSCYTFGAGQGGYK